MTTTNQNRAIYRVAMRQLDARDFARWASAEPELNPLESELIERYTALLPVAEMLENLDETADGLAQIIDRCNDLEANLDAFDRVARGLLDWLALANNPHAVSRTRREYDAKTGFYSTVLEAGPLAERSKDGREVTIPARHYDALMNLLRRLDSAVSDMNA